MRVSQAAGFPGTLLVRIHLPRCKSTVVFSSRGPVRTGGSPGAGEGIEAIDPAGPSLASSLAPTRNRRSCCAATRTRSVGCTLTWRHGCGSREACVKQGQVHKHVRQAGTEAEGRRHRTPALGGLLEGPSPASIAETRGACGSCTKETFM